MIKLLLPNICHYKYEDVYYEDVVLISKKIRKELTLWFDISFYSYIYMIILSFFSNHSLMDAYYWLFMMNSVFWISAIACIYLFRNTE